MRFFPSVVLLFTLLLPHYSCSAQAPQPHFFVNIPTIEQEASSIWRTINDIEFLESQGYTIRLPQHETIDSLIGKAKRKQFGNDDFGTIYTLLEAGVYQKEDYAAALAKVEEQADLLNALIERLKAESSSWAWGFKTFPTYQIVFTRYGTGGSYDPDTGLVTLFTNQAGAFMNYDLPANTIMHEIVHMGIETSIVQAYELPHGLKERIVDKMTFLLFNESLPNYQPQNMGDPAIDAYLRTVDDLRDLEASVKRYQQER